MHTSQQTSEAVNRRDFLKKAGFAAVGLLHPRARGLFVPRPMVQQVDVVVIGGGLAGLTAARSLVAQGVSSVMVLDARPEVGGRVLGQALGPDLVVDGGGQWIGPSHTRMHGLAAEFGIPVFPTQLPGEQLVAIGREVQRENESISSGLKDEFAAYQHLLERVSDSVPLSTPWLTPGAAEYDALSLNRWLRMTGASREARIFFSKATQSILGAYAHRISLLHFLFYIASSGGLDERLGVEGSAQESRLEGGAQRIPLALAAALGDRVLRGVQVRSVEDQPGGRVRVSGRGLTVDARRVVVAMMPRDAARIRFSPRLPAGRRALMNQWPAASVYKANVAYEAPFWRANGLSGQVANLGRVYSVFDNSPPSGGAGVLLAFVQSQDVPSSGTERYRLVLESLARFFGRQAAKPTAFSELDWAAQPHVSGCVSPLGPGFWTRYGPYWRAPLGRVHWAGAETAEVWNGKMEGAVRSGERAAGEVIDLL